MPGLESGDVHVWRANISSWQARETAFHQLLDPAEQRRAMRFHFEKDRLQFVVTHGLTRILLGHYAQCSPSRLHFSHGIAGKPTLASPDATPTIEFNLSHSADWMVLAVAPNSPVGVDVERWSVDVEFTDLIQRFFSPAERREFAALQPSDQCAGFFACWSRKEAYIKAIGTGVSEGLDHFDVSVAPAGPARLLRDRRDPQAARNWQMHDLPFGHGYSGTVVCRAGTKAPRLLDLPPGSEILQAGW
jgi:4'-phosphopantetheinyl transferase